MDEIFKTLSTPKQTIDSCLCRKTRETSTSLSSLLYTSPSESNNETTRLINNDDCENSSLFTNTPHYKKVNEITRHKLAMRLRREDVKLRQLDENGTRNTCSKSCFENIEYVHLKLQNCFKIGTTLEESEAEFNRTWDSFNAIVKYPNSCDFLGTTVYHYAAANINDNADLLRCVLQKYPDGVFCFDKFGITPMMCAVQNNNLACVTFLLSQTGVDLSNCIYSMDTPLVLSVTEGHSQMCKLLLDFNAPLTLSSLRISLLHSRFQIMTNLLEYNASTDVFYSISSSSARGGKYASAGDMQCIRRLMLLKRSEENNYYLDRLDSFTPSPRVYKDMLLDCLQYFMTKVVGQAMLFDNSVAGERVSGLIGLKDRLNEMVCTIDSFFVAVDQLLDSIHIFISENDSQPNLKANVEFSNLVSFAKSVFKRYYKPKTLKELCRFKLRKIVFDAVSRYQSKGKYSMKYRKTEALYDMLYKLNVPTGYYRDYLMHAV